MRQKDLISGEPWTSWKSWFIRASHSFSGSIKAVLSSPLRAGHTASSLNFLLEGGCWEMFQIASCECSWVNRSMSNQLRRRHRIQGNPWKWPIWGAYILGDCTLSSAQHRPLRVQCHRNVHFAPFYNTLVKPSASSRAQNKSLNPVTLVRVLQNNRINMIYLHIYLSVSSLFFKFNFYWC